MSDVVYDVVVVGAGSGGGVVAARLAEAGASTLLVEAGQDFPDEHRAPPAFYVGGNLYGENYAGAGAPVPALDWGYTNVPLPDGRRIPLTRGRLVGGSSMINATLAVRPRPSDLDPWAAVAGPAWSYAGLVPQLRRVEARVPIRIYPRERWLPFVDRWADAMVGSGFAWHDDLNAPGAWGGVVGPYPQNRRGEVRQGTLVTHLRAARPRAELTILPDTLAERFEIDGDRVVGLRVRDAGGGEQVVHGRRFVLAAGVYGSPAVLQRSGIGPRQALAAAGVSVGLELAVGEGLLEHLQVLFPVDLPADLAAGGWPALTAVGRAEAWATFPVVIDEEAGVGAIGVQLLAGHGGGEVTITSPDPAAAPRIDHRFASAFGAGLFDEPHAVLERIVATEPLRGAGVALRDVGPLDAWLTATLATSWHPVGGCALGRVVDPELRVRGLANLRVADASVFPTHVSHNPNITCLAVGERAADLLLGDA